MAAHLLPLLEIDFLYSPTKFLYSSLFAISAGVALKACWKAGTVEPEHKSFFSKEYPIEKLCAKSLRFVLYVGLTCVHWQAEESLVSLSGVHRDFCPAASK